MSTRLLVTSLFVLAPVIAVGCASPTEETASSEAASTAGCSAGTTATVTDGPLRVRPTPDTSQREVAWIPEGDSAQVTAPAPGQSPVRGAWVHVRYGTVDGWVHGDYLSCGGGAAPSASGANGGKYDVALIQTDAEPAQATQFANLPSLFPGMRVNTITHDGGTGAIAFDRGGDQAAFDRNLEALATYYDNLGGADARPIVLALSGHSVGDGFWGSGVSVGHDALRALAARHPRFSSRVAMVYLLACNAGRRVYIEGAWKPAFPSAWLFGGFNNVGPTGAGGGDAFFVTTFARAAGTDPATLGDPSGFARGLLSAGKFGNYTQPAMYSAIEVFKSGAGYYAARAQTLGSNSAWDRAFNDQLPAPGEPGPQIHLVTEFNRFMQASDDAHANPPADSHDVNTNALRVRYNVIQDYKEALRNEGHTSIGADVDVAMYQSIALCLFTEVAHEWLANPSNVALLQSSGINVSQIPKTTRRDLKAYVDRLGTGSPGALALHDMVYLSKSGASTEENVAYLRTLLTTTVGAGDL
jgi:uncharacterized protein YraI